MDTSALVATLTSAMAIGLTIVLLRLMRQERLRSDARVAALVSLSAEPAAPHVYEQAPVKLQRLAPARPAARAVVPAPRPAPATARARQAAPPARLSAADVEIFRDAEPARVIDAGPSELFEPAVPRATGHLLYIGIGALVMVVLIAAGFRWSLSSAAAPQAAAPTTETSAAVDTAAAQRPGTIQPLGLVSLKHEQSADGTLVISGVVRNPAGSIARERLFAAAALVDAGGALIASARAPLDFTNLAPGDESPFVVRIAAANGVARYRVGFRDADGNAVPHLDRR